MTVQLNTTTNVINGYFKLGIIISLHDFSVLIVYKIWNYKDASKNSKNCYTIPENSYIIHTSSRELRLFSFKFLKKVGVNPVTFLN